MKWSSKPKKKAEQPDKRSIERSLSRINALEEELKAKEGELQSERESSNEKILALQQKLEDIEALKAKNKKLEQGQKQSDSQNINRLQAIEELREDVNRWNDEKSELVQKNINLQQQNRALQKAIDEQKLSDGELEATQEQIKSSKAEIGDWILKFGRPTEPERERFIEEILGMRALREEARVEVENSRREQAILNESLEQKRRELTDVNELLEAYKEQAKELIQTLSQLAV